MARIDFRLSARIFTIVAILVLLAALVIVLNREPASDVRGYVPDVGSMPTAYADGARSSGLEDAARTAADRDAVPTGPPGSEEQPRKAQPTDTRTWGARVVKDTTGEPLQGVRLRVRLLSPELPPDEHVLITDGDGLAGPIPIDPVARPGAEVRVDPGPEWSATHAQVSFLADASDVTELRLGPVAVLAVEVVDASSGAPLADAVIRLADNQGGVLWEERTNADGRIERRWVSPGGPFVLSAGKPGHAALAALRFARPPKASTTVRVPVARAGSVRATVVDSSQAPIAGAEITAEVVAMALPMPAAAEVEAWPEPVRASSAVPFALLDDLPVGVTLEVRARTVSGAEAWKEVRIEPALGVQEVTLTVDAAGGLIIRVVDSRGAPLKGATVGVDDRTIGTTDASGEVVVPAEAKPPRGEAWTFLAEHALAWGALDGTTDLLLLTLGPEAVLAGHVVDADGAPQRRVRLTPLLGVGDPARARLARGKRLAERLGERGGARTDETGGFHFRGLPAAPFDLEVRPPKGSSFEVRGLLPNDEDVRIVLPSEADYGESVGIAIEVSVVDATSHGPVPDAAVTAFRSLSEAERVSVEGGSAVTDEAGRARIAFAREGLYWVHVEAEGYLSADTEIVDYPRGRHAVEAQLQPCGALTLSVRRGDGLAAAEVWVTGKDESDAPVVFGNAARGAAWSGVKLRTDAEGKAGANRVPTGRITLEFWDVASKGLEVVAREVVTIRPGEEASLEVRIP